MKTLFATVMLAFAFLGAIALGEENAIALAFKQETRLEVRRLTDIDKLFDVEGTVRVVLQVSVNEQEALMTVLVKDSRIQVRYGADRKNLDVSVKSSKAIKIASALERAFDRLSEDEAINARLLVLALKGERIIRYREWRFPWTRPHN